MHDQEREILSVIMDDEADTQGISEILNNGNRQSVQEQWYRWHQLRDLLKESNRGDDGTQFVDVVAGVRQALDDEDSRVLTSHDMTAGQSVDNE
ncbi:MAG: hypothetical protein EA349_05460 [Halomonadaceae bacterium]|nr:MAG: hypothetical protein EA349_05460 [Halomonadaceae bacterium]